MGEPKVFQDDGKGEDWARRSPACVFSAKKLTLITLDYVAVGLLGFPW